MLLRDRLFDLRKRGFNRLYQGGKVFEFSTPESLLDVDFSKPVFILVDRLAIYARHAPAPGGYGRDLLSRSGRSDVRTRAAAARRCASTRSSPASAAAKTFTEPEPSLFSFNSPFGACKRCQGFGNTIDYDMDLVIPNRSLSIQQGAVDPWTKPQYSGYLVDFSKDTKGKVRLNVPVFELREDERASSTSTSATFSRKWKRRNTKSTCACS